MQVPIGCTVRVRLSSDHCHHLHCCHPHPGHPHLSPGGLQYHLHWSSCALYSQWPKRLFKCKLWFFLYLKPSYDSYRIPNKTPKPFPNALQGYTRSCFDTCLSSVSHSPYYVLSSSHIDPFFTHIKHIPFFLFELLFLQVIMWFMISFYSSLSPDVTVSKSCFRSKFLKQTCICQILLCNNQPQKKSLWQAVVHVCRSAGGWRM